MSRKLLFQDLIPSMEEARFGGRQRDTNFSSVFIWLGQQGRMWPVLNCFWKVWCFLDVKSLQSLGQGHL